MGGAAGRTESNMAVRGVAITSPEQQAQLVTKDRAR